jgi:hypothetical protein
VTHFKLVTDKDLMNGDGVIQEHRRGSEEIVNSNWPPIILRE